jgi:hypothetical protein
MDDFFDATGPEPIDAAAEHAGEALLADARDLLDRGESAAGLDRVRQATRGGLPADVVPHAALLAGAALIGSGDGEGALRELADGWRSHPDFAALPALLGLATYATGDHQAAARTLYAAIASDDPDGTLVRYRKLISSLPGPRATSKRMRR